MQASSFRNPVLAVTLIGGGLLAGPAPADTAIVNFVGGLTPGSFAGPDDLNPFIANGNPLNAFVNSPIPNATDLLRADGQVYIEDFTLNPTGTTTFSSNTPGVKFLLHSPLLERIETDTWRIEGPSSNGTQENDLDGGPVKQRTKVYLPADNTFGEVQVTFDASGNLTDLNYLLDFGSPGVPLFTDTSEVGNAILQDVAFQQISVESDGAAFTSSNVGAVDSAAADDQAYGLFTQLEPAVYPPTASVSIGTIWQTTRGLLNDEVLNNTDEIGGSTSNISSDGRLDGGSFPSSLEPANDVYLGDLFAGETGDLFVYNGTSDLVVGVVIPEPTTAGLFVAGAGLLARRRRRAA